jgi:hypothetical protein
LANYLNKLDLNILPLPGMFKDWKQWGHLLVQALNNQSSDIAGANSGVPIANAAFGGFSPWPTLSPGEFMIKTNAIKSSSLVFVFPQVNCAAGVSPPNGTLYEDSSKRVAGQSFTVKSTDPSDTPDIAWVIFQPV